MIGLLRRVTHAQVAVDGTVIAEVGRGVRRRHGPVTFRLRFPPGNSKR